MKNFVLILLVFCFSSCITCIVCPEISGYVYSTTEKKPIENVRVRFISFENSLLYSDTVYSDMTGHIYFKGISFKKLAGFAGGGGCRGYLCSLILVVEKQGFVSDTLDLRHLYDGNGKIAFDTIYIQGKN